METKFQRGFFILEKEDTGYGNGRVPSGHVKIEIKEQRGKLSAIVRDLVKGEGKFFYQLYLLHLTEHGVLPVRVGKIFMHQNQGDLEWFFAPHNVGGTGKSIEAFKMAVVLVEFEGKENQSMICPLSSVHTEKIPWRVPLSQALYSLKTPCNPPVSEKQPTIKPMELKKEEVGAKEDIDPKEDVDPKEDIDLKQSTNQKEIKNLYSVEKQSEVQSTDLPDIEKLIHCFDHCFEKEDPFKSGRTDYVWWKVSSPVYLNNILYQCNVKTPLLFNPEVMMSHFKYRHLIFGIYSDASSGKRLLVCGIPAKCNIDERPFGSLCRWAQIEEQTVRQDAFGYWLVYMDSKTGKLLSFE